MKKIFLFLILCISFVPLFGQIYNPSGQNAYGIPVFGYKSNSTGLWLSKVPDSTGVQTIIGLNTPTFAYGSMKIYTADTTPLYNISAPPFSLCADRKDTSWYIKVGTLSDSAKWYKVR